jgi:hypothetical protein
LSPPPPFSGFLGSSIISRKLMLKDVILIVFKVFFLFENILK